MILSRFYGGLDANVFSSSMEFMALYPRQKSSCALNIQVLALTIMFTISKSTFEYKTVSLRLTSYLSLITPIFQ